MAEALKTAAAQAQIELPSYISLPLSFSTSEAPSDSVAVFSGTARAKLVDVEFAAQDTATTTSDAIAADLAALKAQEPPVTELPAASAADPNEDEAAVRRALLSGAGIFLLFNMLIIMFSGRSGSSWFFAQGWPIELMLIAIPFFLLMINRRNLWLLIPAGLFFGEGLLLGYYALSERWEDWAFLWPLQVFLVMVVLWYTITRAVASAQAGELAVLWGHRLLRLAVGIILVYLLALIIG
jgi:hypothetical protein